MNKIVLIAGMAGSGKSTVGRLVAEQFPKSLHIKVDDLREMMVKGLVVPDLAGFSDEAYKQFQFAPSTVIYMAQLYASQGVDVVIDDVCVPPNFVEQYAALFENPALHRVLLFPTASAVTERIKKASRTLGPYIG